MSNPVQTSTFRAGVAARLAGIPVETLRVWERRYQLSDTRMAKGQQRQYSREDIQRLALMKRLVDLGQPIRSIAQLDVTALRNMQSTLIALTSPQATRTATTQSIRAGLIGPGLASIAAQNQALWQPRIEVALVLPAVESPLPRDQAPALDVLLIEAPSLMEDTRALIQNLAEALNPSRTVVLYRYAPSHVVRQLRSAGLSVLRAPIDPHDIQDLLAPPSDTRSTTRTPALDKSHSLAARSEGVTPTPSLAPRFSDAVLAQLSGLRSSIYCECPSQLSDLLIAILAFERYSASCANRSPEDEQLHKRLESSAAQARHILEDALDDLIKAEQISLSS